MSAVIPLPMSLQNKVYNALLISVPAGFYHLPASLYPTLLITLRGKIILHHQGMEDFPRLVICGATRTPRIAQALPDTRLLVIAVRHGRLPALFGANAGLFMDRWVSWQDVLPNHAGITALNDGLAEKHETDAIAAVWRTLETLAVNQCRSDALVLPSFLLVQPLMEVGDYFNMSIRQFERRFHDAYGQSLRAYRRQLRSSRLLMSLFRPSVDLAALALEYGFYDQAHMQRDVRHFTGHTPFALRQAVAQQDTAAWAYQVAAAYPRFFGSRGF